ncbi:LytR/AlgR family response regulator transcription factor [Foetidibacter luteolus]|uniref:LytR/AlgR family response regulator transcription factor n=1 Tax=Foetidibacter luteolus TaxID=2608880 RepID=UPI00129B8C72|nr:LytTR family DNA-binding domain-containing protein [Foetidibacter luteolus]
MLKAVLIDDGSENADILLNLLKNYCADVFSVAGTKCSEATLALVNCSKPDVIFIDIDMPGNAAFRLVEEMMSAGSELVFVTGTERNLRHRFGCNVLDYILKPITLPSVINVLYKAEQQVKQKRFDRQLSAVMQALYKTANTRLALPLMDGVCFLEANDIVYCRAKGAYTEIHTRERQVFTSSQSIKEYEILLPAHTFCRVHHSYIVNVNCITRYYKGRGGYLVMADGSTVEVAVRRKEDFLSRFGL